MKRLISILTVFAVCICASAQKPADIYYTEEYDNHILVHNAYTGEHYTIDAGTKAFDIGIDNNHNVYVLVGEWSASGGHYQNFAIYKNGKEYMSFTSDGDSHYFSSMAMKIVGNDVVVAGVETKEFNSKGDEARLVGFVNRVRVYQTEWERKSLKRDQFKGFCDIVGSGLSAKVIPPYNNNSLYDRDTRSRVFYVADVDYVNGFIYTTGWGEREYTVTPAGRAKQYLVRRCPRVWKNGKEVVQQYENRTGAGWSINVMRNEQNILTSGHQRDHLCGWDGNKDMISDDSEDNQINREAAIYSGMVDGVPVFTRMFIDDKCRLLYVNTRKDGNQKPILVRGGSYSDVVVAAGDFFVTSMKENKVYKITCSNWLVGGYEAISMCTVAIGFQRNSLLAVHW